MDARIPAPTTLHIEKFSGAGITQSGGYLCNAVMGKYPDDRPYLTQRPAIDVFEDASDAPVSALGRGIYRWESVGLYTVNGTTVYKDTYGTACTNTLTTGTKKVAMVQVGSYLLLNDSQNNAAYTISSGASTTVTAISAPPWSTLAGGAVELDGYGFLLDEVGRIWHSTNDDPTSGDWNALNVIEAEKEYDGGVFLARHKDHVLAFGTRSMQFFYNNANASGSVLSSRDDIYRAIGLVNTEAVWEEGESIYFLGREPSGMIGAYWLHEFTVEKVSDGTLDAFLTQSIMKEGYGVFCSGFTTSAGSTFTITLHTTDTVIVPQLTLAYVGGIWTEFKTDLAGISKFPLIGWSVQSGTTIRSGEGIMANGDLVTINDNFTPVDTKLGTGYVDDYVDDYFTSSADSGTNIEMIWTAHSYDGGTNKVKFAESLEMVADPTSTSQTLTIQWSDGAHINYNTGRTIDTSKRQKITRMGSFSRRTHKFTYAGSEQYRVEGAEMTLTLGDV